MVKKCRGEFDDYEYPFLNNDTPENREAAKKAMEDAIKLAEELDKKYGK